MKLINIYFKTFTNPRLAFEQLLNNGNYLNYSFQLILIPIVGYTLMYIFLTIGEGAPSVFTPWLNIPKEQYYYWDQFLLAPSMLLAWISSASIIYILSRFANGHGTFEQTLCLIALSISVSMCFGLFHDLPMSFLSALKIINARQHEIDMNSPTIWRTILWVFYSAYAISFFILFPKAVHVIHKINMSKSILIGIFGFIVFQILFLVFNR
jgi:hypothetical protein